MSCEQETESRVTETVELMNGMRIRPFGEYLYFRRAVRGHVKDSSGNVVLYLPDNVFDMTNWNELIAIGPKCKHFSKEDIGGFCLLPETSNGMFRLGSRKDDVGDGEMGSEDWAIRESALIAYSGFVAKENNHA